MEREERRWFGFLILVALAFNAITLSPVVPWQEWLLWSSPQADRQVSIVMTGNKIQGLDQGIVVHAGEYVSFSATSEDVTHGFGVFRQDGTMVFQIQVLPGHENSILWRFDHPGVYDVRSTEYAGPHQSNLFFPGTIQVKP
jgi:cytochrome c oxidase subunit 2